MAQDIRDLIRDEAMRVVGIDLTGSEQRPSGWCLLDGNVATTRRIKADADLVAATLETAPALVSIDSPLGLPTGRNHPFDDDLTRYSHGITRECERILRRRGIHVYPTLIPSMQRLTERGISLAKTFRSHGLDVIESYPGGAQDILGIPRKRVSQQQLADGLAGFGIDGAFTLARVSHDELDAITSAVVGLFFLAGEFEALGSESEGFLIIPHLRQSGELGSDDSHKEVSKPSTMN